MSIIVSTRIKKKRLHVFFVKDQFLAIKGPLGNLTFNLNFHIFNRKLFFPSSALANTFFSRARALIKGIIYGFFIELRTEGVGLKFMRFSRAPRLLNLSLGHSHSIIYKVPSAIKFRCLKYRLLLFSNQFSVLTKTAAIIRGYRPPDPYKGKGVKYAGEALKLKPGKQRQR